MNPWWLKPTADEEPTTEERSRDKPEARPLEPRDKPKSGSGRRPKSAAKPPGQSRKKSAAKSRPKSTGVRRVAVLCDPESLTRRLSSEETEMLDLGPALERLAVTGEMEIKRAYADWERSPETGSTWREAGFQLVGVPGSGSTATAAGIQLAVDAMDLCQGRDRIDTFVLISGDGGLVPLVSKLKANGRKVVGVGLEEASSPSLVDLCDDYLFCDALREEEPSASDLGGPETGHEEAMELMIEAIETLVSEDAGVLWGSLIKQTIQRRLPSFAEADFGFGDFSELLEEGARRKLVKLKKDERSGTYMVTGFSPR